MKMLVRLLDDGKCNDTGGRWLFAAAPKPSDKWSEDNPTLLVLLDDRTLGLVSGTTDRHVGRLGDVSSCRRVTIKIDLENCRVIC